MIIYRIINSAISTTTQHKLATWNRLAPNHAAIRPAIRASSPDRGVCVDCMMAGNVITARVIYGT